MRANSPIRITPQVIIGAALVLFGVLFTLDNLGLIYFDDFARFWPLALIGVGVSWIAYAQTDARRVGGGLMIILGVLFLLDTLYILAFDVWDYWPLILVGVGVGLITQALRRQTGKYGDSSSFINGIAIMSGIGRTCTSQEFRGGELTAIMGGCEVDLSEASPYQNEAVINTFAMWGGIEIKVPDDWSVISQGFALMGGFEVTARPPKGGSPKRLVVKGLALMGGVEIKN